MTRPQAPERVLPKSIEEALQTALLSSKELEAARFTVAAAEAGLATAKANLYPKIDIELTGTNNANVGGSAGHGQTLTSMLRMNYNFSNGGADRSKIQEQINMLEQSNQNLEKSQRSIEQSTRESWNKLTMAQNRIVFMQQHYNVSKQVTASYHEQFKAGKRTLLDVLNSENELFAAKNGLLFEEFNYTKSVYELFSKMGTIQDVLASEPVPASEQMIHIEKDIGLNRLTNEENEENRENTSEAKQPETLEQKGIDQEERSDIQEDGKHVREIWVASLVENGMATFPEGIKQITDFYIGKKVTVRQLQALKNKLTRLYEERGLTASQPIEMRQPTAEGILVVRIPEYR